LGDWLSLIRNLTIRIPVFSKPNKPDFELPESRFLQYQQTVNAPYINLIINSTNLGINKGFLRFCFYAML